MTETELYRALSALTRNREHWKEHIADVGGLLRNQTVKITAKALWLLGEMGLAYPQEVKEYVPLIATFLNSEEPLFRERALNALGRIGRADGALITLLLQDMIALSEDSMPQVRLSVIWASENIATHQPELFDKQMTVFAKLLDDPDERVRIEAPEIFRVLGKRRPEWVQPYLEKLWVMSEKDNNRIVRIHAAGAIKATQALNHASQVT